MQVPSASFTIKRQPERAGSTDSISVREAEQGAHNKTDPGERRAIAGAGAGVLLCGRTEIPGPSGMEKHDRRPLMRRRRRL